jgi:hypothetical protein
MRARSDQSLPVERENIKQGLGKSRRVGFWGRAWNQEGDIARGMK